MRGGPSNPGHATGRPLLFSVYVPTLILAFCQGLLLPVLPLYVRSFAVSYGLVGLVLAGQGIGMLVGDLPAGILLGRLGKKRSMLIGVAGVALANLGLFLSGSLALVFLLRFATGMCAAMWNLARHAYLVSNAPLGRRGRAIAGFGGTVRVGTFVGPAAGGTLARLLGFRLPFLAFALMAGVALAVLALSVAKDHAESGKSLSPQWRNMLHVFREHSRQLITGGSGQFLAQAIRVGRTIILPLYAAEAIGLDVQSVGLMLSVSSFVDMLMFYPAGMIMDRFGRKYAIIPCFLIQAMGMAFVPLTGSFLGLLFVAVFIGFGNGLGSGTMMTLGGDLAPPGNVGEFLGLWRLFGDGGQVGSPLAVGAVAQLFGLAASSLLLSAIGFLSASIFGFLLPETLRKEAAPPGNQNR